MVKMKGKMRDFGLALLRLMDKVLKWPMAKNGLTIP